MSNDIAVKMIHECPDGEAIYFDTMDNDLIVQQIGSETINAILEDDRLVGVMGLLLRKTMGSFIHDLEFTYFPPLTESNKQYVHFIYKFQTLCWAIVMLPRKCMDVNYNIWDSEELLRIVCDKYGLRMVKGVPLMAGTVVLNDGSIPSFDYFKGLQSVEPSIPMRNLFVLESK
jgi:hypothetical protein